ncbi:MAG: replicative DNA helicase [Candidatus Dadabacteria bacterium]|nr:replicative DNA helicase [Candidatus Dadabacteria bacterium]NIS07738.1 replicative DNA helicase [Candidatus Dadabacteria bacterium]NIV42343.1 replicative DNA helicase [Candidatus Dadabacteria bacterium]NIY21379.1 replicative DNA helicase [Candidatus Dadabacteria bacterium]
MELNRPLPQNLEAEQAVLGALIIEGSLINQVLEILTAEDFYKDSHKQIISAMIDLDRDSKPIDLLTVFEFLKAKGQALEDVGGSNYLTYLTEIVPTTANIGYYAQIVKEKSILRNLVVTASDIAKESHEDGVDVDELVDRAEHSILEVGQNRVKRSFYDTNMLASGALEMIEALSKRKEHLTGVPTGFERLDHMTSGLQPSDLIIIAARPGLGKTSFCLNVASHSAIMNKKNIAIYSLEMTKEHLMLRMLSIQAKVNYSSIRSGYIGNKDLEKLVKAADVYSKAGIYIDDTPAISSLELRAKARRLSKDKGLDLIIVDYLQLMRGSRRTDTREREIAEISGSLKSLAKELSVPVIAISQLSRQPESRTDKRPQLSDLRESGALEQDADLVMFIHRADAYKNKQDEKDGTAELIIGKQRNGPTGSIKLAFLESQGIPSFENLDEEHEDAF